MKNPFIVGEKLYLRPLEMDDLESTISWFNDGEVTQFINRVIPMNRTTGTEFIEKLYRDGREIVLGIVDNETDRLIGQIALHDISMPFRHAGLAIIIGDKSYWSRHYGTKALTMMLEYGFNQLNLHKVYVTVHAINKRAVNAYKGVGFQHEGVLRDHAYHNGKYVDVCFMSILKEEWEL